MKKKISVINVTNVTLSVNNILLSVKYFHLFFYQHPGCYPARLKKVLIVTAPLWFKAPFKVLRLFVREKLRDRVFTVSLPQLVLHITPSCLPKGKFCSIIIRGHFGKTETDKERMIYLMILSFENRARW